jgi:fibronectin-binding autotransporter adhesin
MKRLLQVVSSTDLAGWRIVHQSRLVIAIAAAMVAMGFQATAISAADIQWSGATSTDWNDPTNWVGGVLPAAGDNAHLDASGATTDIDPFSDPGFSTTIQQLDIGDANPNATLTQSSGMLNLNGAQAWLKIGAQSGSSGIYNLQGSGVVSLTNDVFGIGEHGVGSFDLSNSAQATAPRVALGRYSDGRGSVFQNGSSTFTVNGNGTDGNGTPTYALAIGAQSTALSSYTITGGTLNVSGGNLLVGMTSGSNGRMTLAGAGVVAASHEVHVGDSGTGTLVVNGGQFTAAGQMIVGNTNGASGTVIQNGGTLGLTCGSLLVLGNQGGAVGSYTLGGGTLAASGRILVGEDGLASFTQSAGANNVTQDISIGDHVGFSTAATPDTYSISGGTLSASALQIGWQGYAVMNQSGGTVTTSTDVHFGGSANGNAQNGRGIYNLSGGTLITPSIFASSAGNLAHQFNFTGGTLRVSDYNTTGTTNILGTLTQTSAANPSLLDVSTQSMTIGASYSVSGQNATARIDNGNSLHIEGIVSIDNGAAITMTSSAGNQLIIDGSGMPPSNSLNIGIAGAGTFTQDGGTNTAGNLVFGGQTSGNGVYSLNGGTLIAGSINGGPGSSTFNLNGGILQASGPSATFFQGVTNAVVQSGGGFINTAGNNVTVAENLLHDPLLGATADGGLAKSGEGTLTLSGANSYSGPTNVIAGSLRVNGSLAGASVVTVGASGILGGTGTIGGTVNIAGGGHLAPGSTGTIGTLTTGSLTLNSGSAIDYILGAAGSGTPSTGGKSSLDAVIGTLALPASGAITVNFTDNGGAAGNGSFANGTYKLFTYNALSGGNATFNNTFSIGTAPFGKLYSFSNTGTSNGEIDMTVVTAPSAKVWNGNINGNWDTTTANWQGGNTFLNNDVPTFDDTAAGTTAITVASGITPAAMTFNNTAKNYTVSGAAIGGTGSLTKAGAGILTLSAANSYSGGTTVSGGTLRVTNASGSATGAGPVTINGGELSGSGAIDGATTINAGAALAPSFVSGAASTLTVNNNLTIANDAAIDFRLNQPAQGDGAGGNDFINSTGTLTLGAGDQVNITPGASFAAGTYHLLGYGALANTGNFAGWSVGVQGTPASLGVRNYGVSNNAANKSVDLTVAPTASNLLLRYDFHDYNSVANPTVADTSGNKYIGTTLRNTNPSDVAIATGPDGLSAIHLTKDDNLGNINGGTATTGSGITTSTQANPALNNPSPGPTTQTLNITNGPFTATAWVKVDSLPTNNPNPPVFQVVFGTPPNSSTDATGSLHMGFRDNAPYMGFWGNDLGGPALPNSFQGNWFHVAFRYNPATGGNPNLMASRQAIFINGGDGATPGDAQLYAFKDNSAAYGQIRTLLIGRTIGAGTFVGAFGGSLADVRVFGAALTNAQIALVAAPGGTVFDWNSSSGADWTDATRWTSTYAQPGPPGTGIADVAEFGTAQTIAAGNTINLNGAQQLAQLINTNANSWTLASGTAAGTNASPLALRQISQRGNGTLTITSGLMIDDTNELAFDGTTAAGVVVAGPIYNSSGAVTKTSPGLLTFAANNSYSGGTTVNSGTLVTTATGTVGPGPLAVNAANGISSTVMLGDSQSISGLSSAVSGTGAATLNIAAGTTLTVNQAGGTTFGGTIINAGTLAKSGSGTLEIDAAPALAANSAIQVGAGVLRFKVVSGSAAVGTGVTATVTAGATLELAGSVSSLIAGANRVNVSNNSQATAGGLLISGANQQVGAIDGLGNVLVSSDSSLTAIRIIQNALVINGTAGHPATVTIAASDSAGNSMAAESSDFSPRIAASISAPIPEFDAELLSSTSPLAAPVSGLSPVAATDLMSVPEPSAIVLFAFGVAALALFRRCNLKKKAFAFRGE